ncbi:MAG: hypothetical protein HRT52_05810 [Colwellia sp.]|nr:hypothetical protein [Colwellia sp.]
MKKTIVTKNSKAGIILFSSICLTVLSACGGGGGGSNSSNDTDTYVPPATTTPPAAEFTSQLSKPSSMAVNDNGSLVLAESGLSLYTFDNDSPGASTCDGTPEDTDTCAGKWPPLLASNGAVASSDMTIITRSDGSMQWALKGMPLYHWFQDTAQGDINGDGINGIWHLARPMPIAETTINDINSYVGNQTIATVTSSADILTSMRIDKDNFTLYTFDNDPLDDSACAGNCINIWPPLLADTGAVAMPPLSVITATNGNKQWAYKGKPLYFFQSDMAAGDINGDEINNIWHIASQEPAIQRTSNNGRSLSATGKVNVLMSMDGSTTEFEVMSMDKDGFSLYVFDNDVTTMSTCEAQCLANWPAFVPSEEDVAIGDFTFFTRTDGTKQWAHQGMPLYFFKNDLQRGDINGDDVIGLWHLILPSLTTNFVEESNNLGSSITVEGSTHVMIRDTETMDFVDQIIDKSGFALYTFDIDTAGVSNCFDACLDAWPALLADDKDMATAPFSIITRDNGMKQWAVNDMPLYFFTPDTSADDINGENVNNIWHIARPAPIKMDVHASKNNLLVAHGNVLASQGKTAQQLQGLTLYTFDADTKDSEISTCFDGCAITWPPLYASAEEQAYGDYTIISRAENNTTTQQWSYQGLPLYFYVGDTQVGDTNGDYPSWTIARP